MSPQVSIAQNNDHEQMVPYHYTTRREWLEDCNIRSSNQLPGQVELLKKGKDRLFVVGPLPPSKSGVATYSIQLARELVRWFEVILVCDTIPTLETEFRHLSPEEFVKERQSNEAVLYHFGNSPFHHFIDSLLEIIPGVVILHDVCLRDLQLWREQGNLHSPRLIKILRQEAEPSPLRCFPTSGEDIGDLNFAPVLLSSHLIVHSKEALRRVLASNENIKKEHISVVPLSRDKEIMGTADGSTAHLGIESDEFVIASFGIISKTKMSMEIVESIGAHFSRHPMLQKVHLIFVGEPHDSQYKSDLEEAFKTLPNKIKVSITGWVSDESYLWHLKRADLCIQLRTQSRGESSAALLDCLTLGKALVISDIPENSEIPEQVVFKISNNSLTQNLGDVLSRSGEYKARGELAKIYADENLSLAANAEVYAKILLGASNDLESLEKRSQRLGGYKNLYVDVSAIHLQDLGTGIQRVVHKTLHYLLRNKSNKFRIVPVFFEAAQNKFMTSETILTKSMDWSTTVFSPSQIRPEKGDIFLGLDLSFTNIYEGELSRFHESEVQIYFVIYDLLPVLHPEFFPSEAVDSFKGWLSMTSKYDGVICISKNTLSDYVAHFPYLPKYFAKGVFPLGSDFDSVPRDFTARETSAARGGDVSFLMVGTIEPRKGHQQVLDAFESLWAGGFSGRLTILGKWGWMIESLRARLEDMAKRQPKLHLIVDADDSELQRSYEHADCLIAASEGEGFGLPIVEAARRGLSVLARDIPVFREVAGSGADYLTDSEAWDQQIFDWFERYSQGLTANPKHVIQTDWEDCSSSLMSLIEEYDYRWGLIK